MIPTTVEEARVLLEAMAPQWCGESILPAEGGSSKKVYFVGSGHVLRIPLHEVAREEMRVERALLERIHGRVGLETPLPVAVDPEQGADLCQAAPGRALDWKQWANLGEAEKRALHLPFARFLAQLHAAVRAEDALAIGIREYVPPDPDALREQLAVEIETSAQRRLLDAAIESIPVLSLSTRRRVLLHNDFSHHNIGFDPISREAVGVFDFGSAFVGDLHRDLRYDPGLGDSDASALDDVVVVEYEARSGEPVSRARQRAWHALSALENLAYSLRHESGELRASRWGWVSAVADWDLGFYDEI